MELSTTSPKLSIIVRVDANPVVSCRVAHPPDGRVVIAVDDVPVLVRLIHRRLDHVAARRGVQRDPDIAVPRTDGVAISLGNTPIPGVKYHAVVQDACHVGFFQVEAEPDEVVVLRACRAHDHVLD